MKSEYLITFDSKDEICTSAEKFRSLLSSHTSISFGKNSTIRFNGCEFTYELALGNLTDGSLYYDLTLECTDDTTQENYVNILKEIRRICSKASGRNIIILHDGVGESYCQQGYPIIYKTENLMRKLIFKFMTISVGYDWSDASTPKEVIDSLRNEGKKEKSNLLHEVDFIQLSTFLFKKYTKTDSTKFIDSLKEKNDEDTIRVGDIKQFSPFTNWEKYFAKKVDCESDYLVSRWEKLYEYRCKIAHCKGLLKVEFDDLKAISDDVCKKIQSALDSIGDIHVDREDREELAENLSSAANKYAADFISKYNKLVAAVQSICELASNQEDIYNKYETNKKNIRMQSNYLCNAKRLIEREITNSINQAQSFRNKIVHQSGIVDFNEPELLGHISSIDNIITYLLSLDPDEIQKKKGVDLRTDRSSDE